MKSKNKLTERLKYILLLLMDASSKWMKIREEVSTLLEESVDDLDPELADRILGFFELLDNISRYFSELVWKKSN